MKKDAVYYAPLFADRGSLQWSAAPIAGIDSFHWERPGYARPRSSARLCAVASVGLFAQLVSDEAPLRCEVTERDGPVWTDSCLELFLQPVAGDPRYLNIEVNPNGVYLSQIGAGREGRKLLAAVTDLTPAVHADRQAGRWSCTIHLSDALISAAFGTAYRTGPGTLRGNFYKCADLAAAPHYGACFPVGEEALGFHNPACFGRIELRPYQSDSE